MRIVRIDIETVHRQFAELEGKTVTVVGRITSIRKFSKLAFIVIRDATDSSLQLFIRQEDEVMPTDRERVNCRSQVKLLFDPGDFVEATGEVMRTHKPVKSRCRYVSFAC